MRASFSCKTWLPAFVLTLPWLWLFHDVIRRLVNDWYVDENYAHGFLIPFISSYAIWTQRQRLLELPRQPQLKLGGALVVGMTALHLAGVLTGEQYASRLALVGSLVGLTLYFGGWTWLKALWFPLGLLWLALPVPALLFNPLAFRLQLLASDVATRVIQACGIPALREGNLIELAYLKLEVVEACSGIRSLLSLTTLAAVYAYFFERRWWRRLALLLAVPPIAVLTNAARVAGTGILAHYRGTAVAEGFLHSFSGVLIFAVAGLLLFALAQSLSFLERLRTQRP